MEEPNFVEELRLKILAKEAPVPPPPTNLLRKKLPNFTRRGVKWSFSFHLFILLCFLLYSGVRWAFPTAFAPPLAEKQYRSAIRVDVVDLPRMKLQDLDKIDLAKEVSDNQVEKAAPSKQAMVLPNADKESQAAKSSKDKKAEKNEADKRLKDLQARLRADSRRKAAMEKLNDRKSQVAGRAALAGNILSEGYSLTGDIAKDLDVYNGKLHVHIRNFWNVPAWFNSAKLQARVHIRVGPEGQVLQKQFITRSGNAEFDQYVEKTLDAADPLPAPPESLRKKYLEEGFECGFPQ